MKKIQKLRKLKKKLFSFKSSPQSPSLPYLIALEPFISLIILPPAIQIPFIGEITSLLVLKGSIEILGVIYNENELKGSVIEDLKGKRLEFPKAIRSIPNEPLLSFKSLNIIGELINKEAVYCSLLKDIDYLEGILIGSVVVCEHLNGFSLIESGNIPIISDYSIEIQGFLKQIQLFPKDYCKKVLIFGENGLENFLSTQTIINSLITHNIGEIGYINGDFSSEGVIELFEMIKEVNVYNEGINKGIEADKRRFIGEFQPYEQSRLFLQSIRDLVKSFEESPLIKENTSFLNKGRILVIKTHDNIKEIGRLQLIDTIRAISPDYLISIGENQVFQCILMNIVNDMSLLEETPRIPEYKLGQSLFLLENKSKKSGIYRRKGKSDKALYQKLISKENQDLLYNIKENQLYKNSKENEELLYDNFLYNSALFDLPNIEIPCYLNLYRYSYHIKIPFGYIEVLFIKEIESLLVKLREIDLINNLKHSLICLYSGSYKGNLFEKDYKGICYVYNIDFNEKNIELWGSKEVLLGEIGFFVKSQSFGFSREFYKGFYQETLLFNEGIEDLGGKAVEIPFLGEVFEGSIGEKPYIQRISAKRHNN